MLKSCTKILKERIYLKSVSSSAKITHSIPFKVEFFAISLSIRRKLFMLFSQWPCSVFATPVDIVGIASSCFSENILKWNVKRAQVLRINGNRSLWYFSQVLTANKTLSRLMALPWRERERRGMQTIICHNYFTSFHKNVCTYTENILISSINSTIGTIVTTKVRHRFEC